MDNRNFNSRSLKISYMSSPAPSSGGGGSFVREEYAFGGSAAQGGSSGGAPAQSDNQRNDISCYLGGK
uniref:Uncharacterized protein n=1 Tax=Strongyloides papillosus TaxID=174720 RepID=A0A0N5CBV5_STREA